MHRFRAIALLVLALLASACSDSSPTETGSLAVATPIPAATPDGKSVDGFAPDFDQGVVIVGVSVGQTLPLRARPGTDQFVVDEIPGDAVGLSGLGETWVTPDDKTWWFVRWQDTQGWIEPGAAYVGAPSDITAEVSEAVGLPSYDQTATIVNAITQYVIRRDGGESYVVAVDPSTTGGPSITVADVLGDRSNGQIGERLTITTTGAAGAFTLVSVQQRPLCGEGLTDSGTCR